MIQKTAIAIVTLAAALSGCSREGVSKSAATDAIQKTLDGQKICLSWSSTDPNKDLLYSTTLGSQTKDTPWGKIEQRISEFQKAGLAEIHPAQISAIDDPKSAVMDMQLAYRFSRSPDAALVRVALTEAGKKLFTPNAGGFCGGRRVVTEITNWSEPAADATGVIVSQVTFKAAAQDVPEPLKKITMTDPAFGPVKGIVQIKKMNDGWVATGHQQIEPIKPEGEAKPAPMPPTAKPTLAKGEAYVGTLSCGDKELGYAIQVKPGEGDVATAVTSFFPTAKNPELKSGCFASKGAFYGNTGVMAMRFDSWILHPPGYTGSNVSAVVRGNEMEAIVPVNGCKPFVLTRSKVPESVPASCQDTTKE